MNKGFKRIIVAAVFYVIPAVGTANVIAEEAAIEVARQYVLKELNWQCGEFIIGLEKYHLREPNPEIIMIRASHQEDIEREPPRPGGGKSLSIEIDRNSMEIVFVGGYQ